MRLFKEVGSTLALGMAGGARGRWNRLCPVLRNRAAGGAIGCGKRSRRRRYTYLETYTCFELTALRALGLSAPQFAESNETGLIASLGRGTLSQEALSAMSGGVVSISTSLTNTFHQRQRPIEKTTGAPHRYFRPRGNRSQGDCVLPVQAERIRRPDRPAQFQAAKAP